MRLKNHYWILRHGEAKSNKEKLVSSWPEKIYNPLTEKGRRQVEKMTDNLGRQKIELIFSSDLLRTKQTAEIISRTLGARTEFDKRLREISMGIYNGNQEQSWNDFFKTNLRRFTTRPPKGENYRDVKKRVAKFIREIDKKYNNKKILIISHGCVLFSLQAAVKNLTEKEEMRRRKNLILKTGEFKQLTTSNKR